MPDPTEEGEIRLSDLSDEADESAHVADRWGIPESGQGGQAIWLLRGWWPICRTSLSLVLRKRIVWLFLGLGLINYLYYGALVYLDASLRPLLEKGNVTSLFLERLKSIKGIAFTGDGESFQMFLSIQNIIVVLLLAFSGAVVVGDDFRFRAVPFYLSKPIGRWHYFFGKFSALVLLACTLTLFPALLLFVQYGLFADTLEYLTSNTRILVSICVYGLMMSSIGALLLLGIASVFRRPVVILGVWALLNFLIPAVGALVRKISFDHALTDPWYWSLGDVWAIQRWTSKWFFGMDKDGAYLARLPYALPILTGLVVAAGIAFWRSLRRVETVR